MTWTRDHDRVIAERCEELIDVRILGTDLYHLDLARSSICVQVDHYYTDIVACIRAADAWCEANGNDIPIPCWNISRSTGGKYKGEIAFVPGGSVFVIRDTPAAALAEALFKVVQ